MLNVKTPEMFGLFGKWSEYYSSIANGPGGGYADAHGAGVVLFSSRKNKKAEYSGFMRACCVGRLLSAFWIIVNRITLNHYAGNIAEAECLRKMRF